MRRFKMAEEAKETEKLEEVSKELSIEDKLLKAGALKEEGNSFFKQKDYKNAMKKYHRAVLYVKGLADTPIPKSLLGRMEEEVPEEMKESLRELEYSCYNNLAACHMKTNRWPKVVEYCKKVLQHQPSNAKALFRRGQAYIHLKDLDRAQEDLKRAETLEPSDAGIKRTLLLLDKELKKATEKEKRTYAAMFENMSV